MLPGIISLVGLLGVTVGVAAIPVWAIIAVIGALVLAIGAIVVGIMHVRKKWPEAWNKIIDVTQQAAQFIVDKLINRLIGAYNALMRAMKRTGSQIDEVKLNFDNLKVSTEGAANEQQSFLDKVKGGASNLLNMDKIMGDIGGGSMPAMGKAAGETGDKLADAMKKMGDSAADFSKEMNDSLKEVRKNIKDLQDQMEDLLVGKIEDTNDERQALAQAYVDQEKEASNLRADIANETDFNERQLLEARLSKLTEDLEANRHLESTFAQEITQIRRDEQKTALQLAKDKFQQNILMIEQEFSAKAKAISDELTAELEKEATLINIQKQAADMAQKFLLEGEKATIESVNRQIEAFNQLATAVQNAKRGVSTGKASLGETISAQQQLEKVAGMSVVINVSDSVLTREDQVVELVGDPLMKVLKQHFAVV